MIAPDTHIDFRRRQAEREIAVTDVGRPTALALAALFLATLVWVPVTEEWLRYRSEDDPGRLPLLELPAAAVEAARLAVEEGPVAADLRLLEALHRAERRLEDESFLRAWLLPPVQATLLAWAGLGNEQVYPGRDQWLFYRADVDHVTGRGFLEEAFLRARRRGGEAWEPPPQPDPLLALTGFREQLAARGIELIVLPIPVKPSVHPERFAAGATVRPVRNPSFEELIVRLRAAGIELFDPMPVLLGELERGSEPVYLRTDTHWTPAAVEAVAGALAAELDRRFELGSRSEVLYERRVAVEGRGDLTGMLRLPEDRELVAGERVMIRPVLDPLGSSWRPSPDARVLLLGDSFTNVFSDARLGWGAGAGLAERLAFALRRPLDRIALNAGGAHAAREALARDLGGGRDRLDGVAVVVYQFAERELSLGDWRLVDLQ